MPVEHDAGRLEQSAAPPTSYQTPLRSEIQSSLQSLLTTLDSLDAFVRSDGDAERILVDAKSQVGTMLSKVGQAATRPSRFPHWCLVFGDHAIPLQSGRYRIGRGDACDIQIQRERVSREHAILDVGTIEAIIEDAGSTNGVFVNGRRIDAPCLLKPGDAVTIGDEQFEIRDEPKAHTNARSSSRRMRVSTLRERVVVPQSLQMRDETKEADMLRIVGAMAMNWLDANRVEDAERALTGHLEQIRARVRAGKPVRKTTAAFGASYALRLAVESSKAEWVDFVIEVATGCALELSLADVAALERLHAQGVSLPIAKIASYLERIGRVNPSSSELGRARERLRKFAIRAARQRGGATP